MNESNKTILEHINKLIDEHIADGFCIDYDEVENECDTDTCIMKSYDCGRYDTLVAIKEFIETNCKEL